MTDNKTDKTNKTDSLISPHGGYEKLESFKSATIVYDGTVDSCRKYRSYVTYKTHVQSPEAAANCLICLTHQVNYLLDQQLRALEKQFLEGGGFTERLYRIRKEKKRELHII